MLEFFNYLDAIDPLSPQASSALMKVIKVKELRKGQVWLQEGAVCDKLTFIVKGLMKLYMERNHKEMILELVKADQFILSATSYFEQLPSPYAIRAVEPTMVVYCFRSDINELIQRYPELQVHILSISKQACVSLEEHLALLLLAPRERWEQLYRSGSWLVDGSRITDRLLAAYLAVCANTLCGWKQVVKVIRN